MSTITAEFVAEARAHYVPAMRWLRANGWTWRSGGFRNPDNRLNLEWNEGSAWRGGTPYVTVNTVSEHGKLLRCPLMADVDSCQQAVDLLVTAGVLPVEFHSLAPTAADHYREIETACIRTGHPLAAFYPDRNASFCACGAAMDLGDFRTASVTV